jgi:hypothetical protein
VADHQVASTVIRLRPFAISRPAILRRPSVSARPGSRGQAHGRRLGDPVDAPPDSAARAVRGRLAAVSVRASLAAGAWVGAVIGLALGAVLGGVVVWFAGAVLDWQRDLAFTFGVTRRLLPFGDQVGLLRDIQARWWLVIIGSSLAIAVIAAAFGALLGGILAAVYNRSPRHALVVVELPSSVVSHPDQAPPAAPALDPIAPNSSDDLGGRHETHGGPL